MTVKYEYVVYVPGIETPDGVAETDGTMTGDEAVALLQDAIREDYYNLIVVARREKGALNWQPIPEAY